MRDKLSVLYYPDSWIEYNTLIKCILLFDEIHFMDRPSFMFNGRYGMVGCASPLRAGGVESKGVPHRALQRRAYLVILSMRWLRATTNRATTFSGQPQS